MRCNFRIDSAEKAALRQVIYSTVLFVDYSLDIIVMIQASNYSSYLEHAISNFF